ncbi:MAG: TonB-dependent receptor plug domain-containing protein, partial [Tidjanibacter sp.]|nr:TonB-dependent receptor plug domain-containing protein [Tidjanibacter sp.]
MIDDAAHICQGEDVLLGTNLIQAGAQVGQQGKFAVVLGHNFFGRYGLERVGIYLNEALDDGAQLAVGNRVYYVIGGIFARLVVPLAVVDGVIWDSQEDNETIHMGAYNNVLSSIDVNDIRDVKILKNGAAIYGARAANGVILINTKRGESLATKITANIYANVSLQPQTYKM